MAASPCCLLMQLLITHWKKKTVNWILSSWKETWFWKLSYSNWISAGLLLKRGNLRCPFLDGPWVKAVPYVIVISLANDRSLIFTVFVSLFFLIMLVVSHLLLHQIFLVHWLCIFPFSCSWLLPQPSSFLFFSQGLWYLLLCINVLLISFSFLFSCNIFSF